MDLTPAYVLVSPLGDVEVAQLWPLPRAPPRTRAPRARGRGRAASKGRGRSRGAAASDAHAAEMRAVAEAADANGSQEEDGGADDPAEGLAVLADIDATLVTLDAPP